jgi:hypothetical protein
MQEIQISSIVQEDRAQSSAYPQGTDPPELRVILYARLSLDQPPNLPHCETLI